MNNMTWMHMLSAPVAVLAVTACTSIGAVDDPAGRKLTWFSYLNGDDLRRVCSQDGRDHLRLVFNADYNKHVRTYDVTADPDGGAMIDTRVLDPADIARIDLSDPLAIARGRRAQAHLTATQYAEFIHRLDRDGVFDPMPDTLRLPSNGIYWLLSGCRGGQWFFTAYSYDKERFTDIRADLPAAAGRSDMPFPNLPAPEDVTRGPPSGHQHDNGVFFEIDVSRQGLAGPTALFGPWRSIGR